MIKTGLVEIWAMSFAGNALSNKGLELTHNHLGGFRILIGRTQGFLNVLTVSYEAAQA